MFMEIRGTEKMKNITKEEMIKWRNSMRVYNTMTKKKFAGS